MRTKPNIFELEALKNELIERVLASGSNHSKLFLFFNYFGTILSAEDQNLNEAFLKEFIDDYLASIKKYGVFGTNPEFTDKLLLQLKYLTSFTFIKEIFGEFNSEIERITKQIEKLNLILEGKEYEDGIEHKAFFPLIDKETPDDFYGIIESVTIRINKTTDKDKFIIVPSEKEVEKKISDQCKKSWLVALDILKKYVKKPYKYHEVIISFDKKEGFYEGNSLGIALTLSILEELLKFYNPAYIIKIKEQTAFTGGITEIGEVLCTSEEIIKQKVAAIFYSEINSFVIPKLEEIYAYFSLTQLKNQYPQRNLKLIPAIDIYDVLNRRDLVDIKKQKNIVRTGKFIKRNWVSSVIAVLLTAIFTFFITLDIDDNPALISTDGYTVFIKNKNGKLLWIQKFAIALEAIKDANVINNLIQIVDINDDRQNEVLYCPMSPEVADQKFEYGSVVCFNYKKDLLWKYNLNDTVYSKRENLPPPYIIQLIDTVTVAGQKQLLVFANSKFSFSSAIFKLNLQSGEKIDNIFWSSGSTVDAYVNNFDKDGTKKLIQWGYDNGYEDVILCCMKLNNLNGYRPTTDEYQILNHLPAKFLGYIRFPKNDYEIMTNRRFSIITRGGLYETKEGKDITFSTDFYKNTVNTNAIAGIIYKINENLKDIDVFIHNDFRIVRDSLVTHGVLKPPYTDTKEYIEIIKSKILYYKDGKWVKREELD